MASSIEVVERMQHIELAIPLSALISNWFDILNSVEVKTWAVFLLCPFFSVVGVMGNFLLLGSTISRYKLWGISIIIAIGMIGLSYIQNIISYTQESRLHQLI